jgi:ubiquinone/menaquinone biosynthesis C-methylase UbiE
MPALNKQPTLNEQPMRSEDPALNEQLAEAAFSKQSPVFDDIYADNTIVHYKRERVRGHVMQFLSPGSSILELNSGTGEDAIFFARQGHHVHATDLSRGMQERLKDKVTAQGLTDRISTELCSYSDLEHLRQRAPYDHIFSNFAGLNCTDHLPDVLATLPPLLKPGGTITLVILPPFCLWESLLVVKGKFKTATRRWFSRKGRMARVEGLPFRCWYYAPSVVKKALGEQWETTDLEGLCSFVPPSYIEGFAEKLPSLYAFLRKTEDKYSRSWPWKYIGDYYIISLRRK